MAHALRSEEFNLVGAWSRNSVYSACSTWSWTEVEIEEEEVAQEIISSLVSPDFVIALRVLGTGEPVPLSMLTIDQLRAVVEYNPVNEKKVFLIKQEDKRMCDVLVKEAHEKSAENSPNSTGDLVDWIFAKIVAGLAKGIIRSVTAMDSRGSRFFLLPKRGIWRKSGGRSDEAGEEANAEEVDMEPRKEPEEEEEPKRKKQRSEEKEQQEKPEASKRSPSNHGRQ